MKKSLLFMAALTCAAPGFAQTLTKLVATNRQLPVLNQKMEAQRVDQAAPAVRRSVTNGVYYSRPTGAFYRAWAPQGNGTLFTTLYTPLTKKVTFHATPATASWKQGGSALNVTGNLQYSPTFGWTEWTPTLVNNADSFSVGMNNLYAMGVARGDSRFSSYSAYASYLNWGMTGTDSIQYMYASDDHAGFVSNGSLYSNTQVWGALSTDYMYGTGTVTEDDETGDFTCVAVSQIYGTTAAPLYVVSVPVAGATFSTNGPIPAGKQLTAYITGVKTNSNGRKVYDDEDVLDTLYASSSDTVDFKQKYTVNKKVRYEGSVIFSKKTIDEFGNETNAPFVIPEGKEFAIVVTGFNQDGVDFGIDAMNMPSEDSTAVANFEVTNGTSAYSHYYPSCTAKIGIYGMYDGVLSNQKDIYNFQTPSLDYNVVKISDDGATNLTYGASASGFTNGGNGVDGVVVATSMAFFDENGTANYDIEDLPDWVTKVNVETVSSNAHLYLLSFTANALPSGTTGRIAKIHLTKADRGVVASDDNVIELVQGDAATGINTVESNAAAKTHTAIFNLAGHQVNKDYKGVVIEDGVKRINK